MKRFLIQTSVENVEGSQTWYVDAESKAQALEKYKAGEADIYASEVDVTSLGAPEWAGETTLDDFGDFGPTTPPQRKPLTDEEIWKLAANCLDSVAGRMQFARAIEAAHGIGEKK